MSEETSPGERARRELELAERIAGLIKNGDEKGYRIEIAMSQARIEVAVEDIVRRVGEINARHAESLKDIKEWQGKHQAKDDDLFRALGDKIDSKFGSVSSAVNKVQDGSKYSLIQIAGGFIVLCGALGALIQFISWVIGTHLAKP
jgi:hypothetical protein